jgi:hypothetical protein
MLCRWPTRISRASNVARLAEVVKQSAPRLYDSMLAFRFPLRTVFPFRKHSPSKGADIRIARKSRPEELSTGFLLSVSAPHYATKKYIVAFHFISF